MSGQKQIEEMAKELCHAPTCEVKKNGGTCYKYCKAYIYAFRAINADYRKLPENIGEFSDGYHTFNELYHHRAVLFSVICNAFPEKAWKSRLHDTGDMFEGMFIVGIETPEGQATYHYDIDPYWDMFKVKELERAPKWDGHTPAEAIQRIGNLSSEGYRKQSEGENISQMHPSDEFICEKCGIIIRDCFRYEIDEDEGDEICYEFPYRFCPRCGMKVKGDEGK